MILRELPLELIAKLNIPESVPLDTEITNALIQAYWGFKPDNAFKQMLRGIMGEYWDEVLDNLLIAKLEAEYRRVYESGNPVEATHTNNKDYLNKIFVYPEYHFFTNTNTLEHTIVDEQVDSSVMSPSTPSEIVFPNIAKSEGKDLEITAVQTSLGAVTVSWKPASDGMANYKVVYTHDNINLSEHITITNSIDISLPKNTEVTYIWVGYQVGNNVYKFDTRNYKQIMHFSEIQEVTKNVDTEVEQDESNTITNLRGEYLGDSHIKLDWDNIDSFDTISATDLNSAPHGYQIEYWITSGDRAESRIVTTSPSISECVVDMQPDVEYTVHISTIKFSDIKLNVYAPSYEDKDWGNLAKNWDYDYKYKFELDGKAEGTFFFKYHLSDRDEKEERLKEILKIYDSTLFKTGTILSEILKLFNEGIHQAESYSMLRWTVAYLLDLSRENLQMSYDISKVELLKPLMQIKGTIRDLKYIARIMAELNLELMKMSDIPEPYRSLLQIQYYYYDYVVNPWPIENNLQSKTLYTITNNTHYGYRRIINYPHSETYKRYKDFGEDIPEPTDRDMNRDECAYLGVITISLERALAHVTDPEITLDKLNKLFEERMHICTHLAGVAVIFNPIESYDYPVNDELLFDQTLPILEMFQDAYDLLLIDCSWDIDCSQLILDKYIADRVFFEERHPKYETYDIEPEDVIDIQTDSIEESEPYDYEADDVADISDEGLDFPDDDYDYDTNEGASISVLDGIYIRPDLKAVPIGGNSYFVAHQYEETILYLEEG